MVASSQSSDGNQNLLRYHAKILARALLFSYFLETRGHMHMCTCSPATRARVSGHAHAPKAFVHAPICADMHPSQHPNLRTPPQRLVPNMSTAELRALEAQNHRHYDRRSDQEWAIYMTVIALRSQAIN